MGKRKKNKGEKKDPRAILERAENLFKKGNYLLAEREFAKAGRIIDRTDIVNKIEICRKEIEKANAQDLVKKAKKLDGSGQAQHALACFQEAYEILREEWILSKIGQLKDATQHQTAILEAEKAEASKDYLNAAALYEQASENHSKIDMVLKQAECLLKAEAWNDSLKVLEKVSPKGPKQWYDYGFASAMAGKFCQCLKIWDNIASTDNRFLAQKTEVSEWLASDLYRRFEKGEDFGRIYEEGQFLIDSGYERDGLADLVAQSAFHWIESLWKEKRYEAICRVLENLSAHRLEMPLLRLRGQIAFKVAERSGEPVDDLVRYWLSALFLSDDETVCKNPQHAAAVREFLIKKGEDLIRQYGASDEDADRKMLARWDLERSAVENLYQLAVEQDEVGLSVCTPSLAAELNISSDLLSLIQKHEDFFEDREQWLLTGCCYSQAWEGLKRLLNGEYQEALEALSEHTDNDPFLGYGRGRVLYEYGLDRMERGERPPDGYAQWVADLLKTVPGYENRLADRALEVRELPALKAWEGALHDVYAFRPSKRLSEALSLMISTRAALMFKEDMISNKVLMGSLNKALSIYPQNEYARNYLEDANKNQEMIAIDDALYRHKMNRACKIARETEQEDVREFFFTFFERLLDELRHSPASEENLLILRDMQKWCSRVDPDHGIVDDIEEMIEKMMGR